MGYTTEQIAVVNHDGGHAIVGAVAGSGKTHTMVARVIHLLKAGVEPRRILVLMFNKSAQEEFERRLKRACTEEGLPVAEVLTFHGFGMRISRRLVEAGLLNGAKLETEGYTIRKMAREILQRVNTEGGEDNMLDLNFEVVTEFLDTIDILKGELFPTPDERWAATVRDIDKRFVRGFSLFEEARFDRGIRLFSDLIYDPVMAALSNPDVERFIGGRYDHVIIDEFQDINEAQMTLVRMIAGKRAFVMAVGDEDQCLPPGTLVTMADGSTRTVESVQPDDLVRSAIGNGRFSTRRVTNVRRHQHDGVLVKIRTAGGRELLSTPEHVHFAGFKAGVSPQRNLLYLMHKKDIGYRLGITRVYSATGQKRKVMTFRERCRQERADGVWVLRTFDDENEARIAEIIESLRYQIPTLPFVARPGRSENGFVHDQSLIDRVFLESNSWVGGSKLLDDLNMSLACPHYQPRSRNSSRRNLVITLCADPRGRSTGHTISFIGNSDDDRQQLEAAGINVRVAKAGSSSWRLEKRYSDFGELLNLVEHICAMFPDINVVRQARLGSQPEEGTTRNSLPFCPASHARTGMIMFADDGSYDTIVSVETIPYAGVVYDIDVDGTHNFIANGLVTHNCIYSWRGAKPDYMTTLFRKEFPESVRYTLPHTFRYGHSLSLLANFVITRNGNRTDKICVSGIERDTALDVRLVASNPGAEALKIVKEWTAGGRGLHEIAVLVREYAHSISSEVALLQDGIPYRIVGAAPFFDRADVLGLRAYLQLAAGGMAAVESVERRTKLVQALLMTPTLYLRRDTVEMIAEAVAESPDDLLSIAETFFRSDSRALPFTRDRRLRAIETWRWVMGIGPTKKAADLLGEILQRTNLQKEIEKNIPDPRESAEKIRMIWQIVKLARERGESPTGFVAFLDQLAADYGAAEARDDRVLITSCHRAKGLEWPLVILPELTDGSFPVIRDGSGDAEIEDERRLFYVAATRAKERLALLAPMDQALLMSSRTGRSDPPSNPLASRFLYEANLTVAVEGLATTRKIQPDPRCAAIIDRYRRVQGTSENPR